MLITILIVLLILGLALYAVQLAPIDGRIARFLQILLIVIAIIYIIQAVGLG